MIIKLRLGLKIFRYLRIMIGADDSTVCEDANDINGGSYKIREGRSV